MRRDARRLTWVSAALAAVIGLGALLDAGVRWRASHPEVTDAVPAFDAAFRDGVRLLESGRDAAALARFHEVLLVAPTLPEAHVNAGFALLGLGRHRAARDAFVGAIELREMQANAYWGLAVALEALGDIAGARGAMRTFVHLAPPGVEQVRRARAALWEWEREPRFPRARDGSSAAPISVSSQRAAVAP